MANGASGKNVLTVVSSDPGVFSAQTFSADFILDGEVNKTQILHIFSSEFFPEAIQDWPIKPMSLNLQNNVADFGAQYILFYNDDGADKSPVSSGQGELTAAIEAKGGKASVFTILAG
ncbi:hypothetical protein CCHL11_02414 [Colletotrichum chlorophyti]|uniref:Uncharacterized protein n=1 Tax=Colletotrichum chlorophyti TaxID=708187 RepID=A0A1Q8S5K1_9PEZI|nr:hypothetical protein CCHL11_02414 [Colletotrichum chlorophyti]